MLRKIIALITITLLFNSVSASPYDEAISSWKSHEDVGNWLNSNFTFDTSRQRMIATILKTDGPTSLVVRNPTNLFERNSSGWCGDSANFALKSLNKIDPAHNARWVFIWNNDGPPHHWVTAFNYNKKLYIMDFGTGDKWTAMQGIHGPYDSLDGYHNFLASLNITGFEVGEVAYRDMPGDED
ncbi:hypothetical protein [Solemya pervernicosa gill symbiont]|nr:hypothetical protein [Solemya pervernicosa gill symbiont]